MGRLLRKAAGCGEAKVEGMTKVILKREPALFTFVYADGVEPVNNKAERAAQRRHLEDQLRRFCTNSERGSRLVDRILTATTTRSASIEHFQRDSAGFTAPAHRGFIQRFSTDRVGIEWLGSN